MDLSAENSEMQSIAQLTRETRESFAKLLEFLETAEGGLDGKALRATLSDAFERFQLWAGNIGAAVDAHRKISLEWRLRDAAEIKEQICELQSDLIEALNDCMWCPQSCYHRKLMVHIVFAITTGERQNRTKGAEVVEVDLDISREPVRFDAGPVDEAKDILEVIQDCVRSLLRLSVVIRKASPRDRWNRALQKSRDHIDDQFDIRHVGEKFPKLNQPENAWLKVRLSRAITQRRQFIRYCRDHKDQLSAADVHNYSTLVTETLEESRHTLEDLESPAMAKSDAITLDATVSEESTKASTLQVAQIEAARLEAISEENDDASAVSSVVSSIDPTEEGTLRLPSLQDVSQGQLEFECPLCFTTQSFRRQRKWK
jgi:hypothetical protein